MLNYVYANDDREDDKYIFGGETRKHFNSNDFWESELNFLVKLKFTIHTAHTHSAYTFSVSVISNDMES